MTRRQRRTGARSPRRSVIWMARESATQLMTRPLTWRLGRGSSQIPLPASSRCASPARHEYQPRVT